MGAAIVRRPPPAPSCGRVVADHAYGYAEARADGVVRPVGS
ncbi:hypothetical protein ACFFOU_12725 [Pseudonocardia sulfidoxydans]|nr:hypothetical protein [Pseudonocardia sulfidoxydans]